MHRRSSGSTLGGAAIGLLLILAAAPAAADLRLSFHAGRVTIEASDVPLRQILAEWSRRGGTRIVGLEKVAGPPVTLTLTDLPEARALEVLLRPLAGYLAAPRRDLGTGASVYDTVFLLPTSVAAPAPPQAYRPPTFRPPPPQPFPDPIDLANQDEVREPAVVEETPVLDPNGGQQTPPNTPEFGAPGPRPAPGGLLQPPDMPTDPNAAPAEAAPADPTGPLTSPRPGVLPLPQPSQGQQQRPRS
ncbi:MAG TPA: hypothetical protein VF198_04975 [Vicinamibacterales bacterium]